MKIFVGGRTFDVCVRYIHNALPEHGMGLTTRTIAMVRDTEQGLVALGESVRNPKDTNNRVKGRNLAIARALQASGLTRTERTVVWNQIVGRGWKGVRQ